MRNSEIKLGAKVKVRVPGRPPYDGILGSTDAYDGIGRLAKSDDASVWVDGRNNEKGWVPLAQVDLCDWAK